MRKSPRNGDICMGSWDTHIYNNNSSNNNNNNNDDNNNNNSLDMTFWACKMVYSPQNGYLRKGQL